jgi:hypothetical protein
MTQADARDNQAPQLVASARPRKIHILPLLLPGASVVVAVITSVLAPEAFHRVQVWLETPAPYLVAVAATLYLARAVVTRNPLYMILAGLGVAFTCREFHFAGSGTGVYVALVALGIWAGLWWKKLREPLRDWRHTSWLLAAMFAYFLSQLIARRAFRGIPGEHEIHRSLEEWAETTAHLIFIAAAVLGSWKRYGRGVRRD